MRVPAGHPDHITDQPFIGRCDGCPANATVIYERDAAEIRLCDQCSAVNAPALRSEHWTANRYIPA